MLPHHWQHKSLVVVGVLPDQVDSSWSTHRHGGMLLLSELLAVQAASLRHQLGDCWKFAGHGAGSWCKSQS